VHGSSHQLPLFSPAALSQRAQCGRPLPRHSRIIHHFLACWRDLDPAGSKNRGLLSLMRRHRPSLRSDQHIRLMAYLGKYPALKLIYRCKQRLCYLLLKKHRTRRQCQFLNPWFQEIVAMWRFTRNNGITEGFHNKMELINRQAYGFRNFENYRLRVKVLCG